MIKFKVQLSTGNTYNIKGFPNSTLFSVLNNFIINKCPTIAKIKMALNDAKVLDMNRTLSQNNIKEGTTVILMTENKKIIPINQNNKIIPITRLKLNNFSPNQFSFGKISSRTLYRNYTSPDFNPNENNINKSLLMNPIPPIINKNFEFYIQKCLNFLNYECNIPQEIIDFNFICVDKWVVGRKTGPEGYEKDYYAPVGWIGIGLKVWNKYDNGDNTWLETANYKGEWYNAYHPIKTKESISSILDIGFRRGPFQDYKYENNINILTKNFYPKCGEGVYFIPDINEAKRHTNIFPYLGDKFRVCFMVRVNPFKVRIAKIGINQESWIVNGDKLDDPFGKKRDDEVRPYRILLFFEK